MIFSQKKQKKLGLALGSGGFRGSAHIGVIKALIDNKISIDFLAGSSIGALIGAHYAIFKDVERTINDVLNLQKKKLNYLKAFSLKEGFIGNKYLMKDLLKMFKGAEFKNTQVPISIVATDLISGKPFVFTKGDLAEAVMSSISIPVAFKPVKYNKETILIDGGISNPVPDDIVKKMGADVVLSVNLYNDYIFSSSKFDMFKIMNRATEITLLNLSKNTLKDSDVVINPDTSSYSGRSRMKAYFDKNVSLEIMTQAEKKTLKEINTIKKLLN
ncbi:MAG TPA: patatin-like phospholipase family protein [bacterium]|nr:patatin-like phospholipase family protein [bacterium]HPV65433.1 patatin-like phospholipase family protein [bacterium]